MPANACTHPPSLGLAPARPAQSAVSGSLTGSVGLPTCSLGSAEEVMKKITVAVGSHAGCL